MSKIFWLTNEDADISGYKRLKLDGRSDCPSLIRYTVSTVAGPTSGVSTLAWISDPLDGTDLTAAAWQIQVWAKEDDAAANVALRSQVYKFTVDGGEAATVLDDTTNTTELGTVTRSSGRTTPVATATTMADGDRLVFKLLLDDATSSMTAGHTVTISYNGQRARSEGDSYIICPDDVYLTAELPATTRLAVRKLLQDNATTNPHLKDQSIDQAWGEALREYTRDKPFIQTDTLTGDGATREFPMPRKWIQGFSTLLQIEYPVNVEWRSLLELDDWEIISSTLGTQPTYKFRFMELVPDAIADNVLLRYTTRHIHTDEEDTIPAEDFDAVVCLAASYACLILAAEAAATSEPTLMSDSVQYRDAAQRWQSLAQALRGRYDQRIRHAESVGAASVTRDWDIDSSVPGEGMIFHMRRWH